MVDAGVIGVTHYDQSAGRKGKRGAYAAPDRRAEPPTQKLAIPLCAIAAQLVGPFSRRVMFSNSRRSSSFLKI